MPDYTDPSFDPWSRSMQRIGTSLLQMNALNAQRAANRNAGGGSVVQRQFAPVVSGVRNIASALAMRPQLQARSDQVNAQRDLLDSEAEEHRAHGRNYDADTENKIRLGEAVQSIQRTAPLAEKAILAGNFDDPNVQEFSGAAAAVTGMNKGDVEKAITENVSRMAAVKGNTPLSAALSNPASAYKTDMEARAGAKAGAPNAAFVGEVNKIPAQQTKEMAAEGPLGADGKPVYPVVMPKAVADKLQLAPALLRQAGVPADLAVGSAAPLVMGTNATLQPNISVKTPASTNMWGRVTPAVTQTNSMTIQPGGADQMVVEKLAENPEAMKVLKSMGLADSLNGPGAQAADQTLSGQPADADTVRVQHPDGRTGTIPRANLAAAQKAGFKAIE